MYPTFPLGRGFWDDPGPLSLWPTSPALEHFNFFTVLLLTFLKSFLLIPVSGVDQRLDLNPTNK